MSEQSNNVRDAAAQQSPGHPTPYATTNLSHRHYSEDWFSQFDLDRNLVFQTFAIAVISGIVAAMIDEVLGLPARNLAVTAGGMIGALNGMTYASLKRCHDRSCLVTGLVNGWLAYMVWYFALQAIGRNSGLIVGQNWFEATLTGLVTGGLGFGWVMVVQLAPRRRSA